MADVSDYLYCDKKECNLGESITFKLYYPLTYNLGMLSYGREGINVYEDNVLIDSNVEMEGSDGYFYTPSTSGTHTIKIEGYNYITVEITVTGGDNGVTWTIGNKEVKSLTINNKEVKSILRTSDNTIIYEKIEVVKIDTQFTTQTEFGTRNYYLKDINGNLLVNKPIKYGHSMFGDDYTWENRTTNSAGNVGTVSPYEDIKLVFEGDSEYNPCEYTKNV